MKKTFWLTLGDFEDCCGRIVELTLADTNLTTSLVLTHSPAKERQVFGKGFTGAAYHQDRLWVCGFNAIYCVDPAQARAQPWLVRDDFNDLHHLAIAHDRIYVANTGHDRVEVFDTSKKHLGAYALTGSLESALLAPPPGDDPYFAEENCSTQAHLRKLADRVHPNHITLFDDRLLVTRFCDQSLQDLRSWQVVLPKTPGHPHDGFVHNDRLMISCTRGLVLSYKAGPQGQLLEVERLDVFESSGMWGWCRGLWVDDEFVLVGLTRITRMPRYRWCDRPFKGTRTSVLLFERASGALLSEAPLASYGAHPKLFSIVEIPSP